jgi:hypothetical protein
MNTKEFLEILRNPQKLENNQVYDLEYVINSFPYFQAARAMHLKSLKNQNSFRYNQSLKTVAAYTTDRNVLFQFITSENFLLNKKFNQNESDFIKEIELIDESVINNINKKNTSQDKIDSKTTEVENFDNLFNLIKTTKEHKNIPSENNKSTPNITEKENRIKSDLTSENFTHKPEINIDNTSEKADEIEVFVENISDTVSLDDLQSVNQKSPIDELLYEKNEKLIKNEQENDENSLIESLRKDVKETRYIPDNSILIENKIQEKSFLFEFDKKDKIVSIEESKSNLQNKIGIDKPFSLLFEPINEESKSATDNKIKQSIEETDLKNELNKPLNFKENDRFSFNEWMHLSSFKPIDRSIESKNKKMDLIDEFIEKNPRIKPVKNTDSKRVNILDNKVENHLLMTETLAQVYTQQKKYQSAIKAYEVLSLKFPEKSGFFADQIKILEKLK